MWYERLSSVGVVSSSTSLPTTVLTVFAKSKIVLFSYPALNTCPDTSDFLH